MAAIALAAVAVGCAKEPAADAQIASLSDLKGKTCAVCVGTVFQDIIERAQPGVNFSVFNDWPSAVEALRLGKADAVPMDTVIARRWALQRPDDFRILLTFGSSPYGYVLAKDSPLRKRVNAVLASLKVSGELDRIVDKWCNAADLGRVESEPRRRDFAGNGGTLRFATAGGYEPGSFLRNGEIVGFDVDILRRAAAALDMKLEILEVNASAVVAAVQSGKADVGGGCMTITESRKESVDFTDCYMDGGYALLGRAKRPAGAAGEIRTAADLKGRHVAHMSSDLHRGELEALQPGIVFDPYSEFAFAIESLRKRKIDAISLGRTYADIWMAKFPGEFRVAFDYADDVCAFLLPKGSPLKPRIDAEIRRMRESGELARIVGKWVSAAKEGRAVAVPEFPPPPPDAPEVRVASAAQIEPWCFISNGRASGAEIEILSAIASRIGVRIATKVFSWGGMVDCVNAGKCEIANGGIYTNGLTFPTVDVSEKYADERMCLLVRAGPGGGGGFAAFARSLKNSFVRTFVTESRWRMLANGFGVTLFITFMAGLLGTALAFPVWLARTSRVGVVAAAAKSYVAILQGTPILVLLMVLFYLVFGKVDVDGVWVAVVGFALNASAYVGEMLRSGVSAIPRGQTEAALALGYPPRRAFVRFVLPQAVRTILPVYRGEMIGLLKSTSIVGYIAIGDLTKASDLVRSRTYESFFPILTTAFVYFVASWGLAVVLDRLGRRFDPASRRARRKGAGDPPPGSRRRNAHDNLKARPPCR